MKQKRDYDEEINMIFGPQVMKNKMNKKLRKKFKQQAKKEQKQIERQIAENEQKVYDFIYDFSSSDYEYLSEVDDNQINEIIAMNAHNFEDDK